ncbi:MAG: asparagine synthetase A [Conexivisphaerales archaeon]
MNDSANLTVGAVGAVRSIDMLSADELKRRSDVSTVMTHVIYTMTRSFTAEGFEWMLPVIISKCTDPLWPDAGASIEKRLELEIYDEPVRATMSMIVHKMVACSLLAPKIFVISPNVRVEKRERATTGRHIYEFNQLDFEVRDASSDEVRRLAERAIITLTTSLREEMSGVLARLGGVDRIMLPKVRFPVFDREELEESHGKNWEETFPSELKGPAWVVNMPREFYDYEDPATGRWDNYDLFLPGKGEVLSGAKREWELTKLLAKMKRDGVKEENYSVLLRLAKEKKLLPSAGGGFGVERLVGWIVGAEHVGEVQPFPRVPGTVGEL